MPLKELLKKGLRHQVNWMLGYAFNAHGSEKIKVKCPCGATISQGHIEDCNHWDPYLRKVAGEMKCTREELFAVVQDALPEEVEIYLKVTKRLNELIKEEIQRLTVRYRS